MPEILLALQRSLAALTRPRVWLYLLTPALLALLLVVGFGFFGLQQLVAFLLEQPPFAWVAAWGALWLAHVLALLGGWMLILAACYLVATLLTAIIVLPLLLAHVAAADYPDLAQLGSDSVVAATWNSLWAAVLFIVGWLVTLPLWLIPGLALILPFFWMGWLNRRTFAYDALAAHATDDEWRKLKRDKSTPLLMLGLVMAVAAHVPFLGLLAPSFAALAYVHYCLEALRRLRGGAVVAVERR